MMRILVPLAFFAVLIAACGGGSSPHATPTPLATATRMPSGTPAPTTQAVIPFTPVEEVLTPPPDIDTSGWLTYRDEANGFEIKYPPDAQVKRGVGFPPVPPTATSGTGTEFDLPFERGTTLEGKSIFVSTSNLAPISCIPDRTYFPDIVLVHIGAISFWRTHAEGAAAGNGYRHTIYDTSRDEMCLTIDGMLSIANQLAFGVPTPDYATEITTFAAIVATFRWID